jgi:hypothetical protein
MQPIREGSTTMADCEQLQNLTPWHRREYHRVFLCDDKESVLVEDRNWMLPFVGRNHPAPEAKILCSQSPLGQPKNQISTESSKLGH